MSKKTEPTVFLIENDDAIRRILEEILQLEGYAVRVSSNRHVDLNEVRLASPSLIILDWTRPKLGNGANILDEFRKASGLEKTPILVTTTLPIPDVPKGANALLQKPFQMEELLDIIRGEIAKSQTLG